MWFFGPWPGDKARRSFEGQALEGDRLAIFAVRDVEVFA
jgi:hypothetical protein